VVISHDDRYYHVGDRIIKLDYGKLECDTPGLLLPEAALEIEMASDAQPVLQEQ
jgi:ABC-type siderophore export system fused ATPase/permease subunit